MVQILVQGIGRTFTIDCEITTEISDFRSTICNKFSEFYAGDFYLCKDGKVLQQGSLLDHKFENGSTVRIAPRVLGGIDFQVRC